MVFRLASGKRIVGRFNFVAFNFICQFPLELTEYGFVDDVRIGQPDFHRMFVVVDFLDRNRNRFVNECDVSVAVERDAERERAIVLLQ